MSKAKIIGYLDDALSKICTANPNYQIYRIGSSLFEHSIPIHDIDYLLIDESRAKDFTDQILDLKTNFSGQNFLHAAVSTHDSFLDGHFLELKKNMTSLFGVEMMHFFGFGPIPMPDNNNVLVLHLAGPMNVENTNFLFKQFPLFYLIWFQYHVKLGTKDFNKIIVNPHYTTDDITEEFTRIYTRAKTIESLKVKKQCLKRLMLINFVLQNHNDPFVASFQKTIEMDRFEVVRELEKYAGKIY